MSDHYDIVIIGAGAAGIAAGRRLSEARCAFRILEARGRIGGRAHTVMAGPYPVDLGAGWLHAAERNMWRAAAEHAGVALDRSAAPWERRAREPANPVQAAFGAAFARFAMRIDDAEAAPDRPAAEYLTPGDAANPMIDAVCTYLNGVTLEHVSAHDYARYDGAGGNQRLPAGYGALLEFLAAGLPVALNARARRIDHSGDQVRIETNQGVLTSRALIVAVPTPVIASETLSFSPPLSRIVDAARGLPLGVVNKMYLGFEEGDVPSGDGNLSGRAPSIEHGSYDLRPLGRPLIEAFIAGPLAEELERGGPGAAAGFVLDELADLLGAEIRPKLRPLALSAWAGDRDSGGSYSYARPGAAEARAVLAAPATERIFIAGEAAAPAFFGTAHGAGETGVIAADRALAAIGSATTRTG